MTIDPWTVAAAVLVAVHVRMLWLLLEAQRELAMATDLPTELLEERSEEGSEEKSGAEASAQAEAPWPLVSVVITARDEELHLEAAARTLLELHYRPLQLVAVNDRSTDATGEILDRLATEDPRLTVVHIDSLPSGWLGKNHAIERAVERAEGEYVLLTDADVFMRPETLRCAVAHARRHQLDHLVMLPETRVHGFWLRVFINTFAVLFSIYFKPWRTRRAGSREFVGVGAFNLLRRDSFTRIDGMAPIRMRPDDDVMLGKLVKQNGLRQDVVNGVGMVEVPWYESLGQAIRGLEKNAFASAQYSVTRVVLMTLWVAAVFLGPWAGLAAPAPARWLFAAAVAVQLLISIGSARQMRYPLLTGVAFPIGVLLMLYAQARSAWLARLHNGIRWRGTHYPLSELRANRI